jgi:hypothetical protein
MSKGNYLYNEYSEFFNVKGIITSTDFLLSGVGREKGIAAH